MTREMGAMMAAIIMAGRTGAAFAAQLGTMQVNEEIDALKTLGVDPIDFLVLPRMVALILMMPLLYGLRQRARHLRRGTGRRRHARHHATQYWNQTVAWLRRGPCARRRQERLSSGSSSPSSGCLRGIHLRPQRRRRRRRDHVGRRHRDRLDHRRRRAVRVTNVLGMSDGALRQDGRDSSRPPITVDELTMAYGSFVLQRKPDLRRSTAGHLRHHGRQRLRQEYAVAAPDRPEGAGGGQGLLLRREPVGRRAGGARKPFSGGVRASYSKGALLSSMTLAENIALPLQEYTDLPPSAIREVASLKLALVGLAGFEDYLSPGDQRRHAEARRAWRERWRSIRRYLFFDEPSAGLDPISSKLLDDLILQLRDVLGATIVMVTHELPSIFAIASNAVYLDNVKRTITAEGDPKHMVRESPEPVVRDFLTREGTFRGSRRSRSGRVATRLTVGFRHAQSEFEAGRCVRPGGDRSVHGGNHRLRQGSLLPADAPCRHVLHRIGEGAAGRLGDHLSRRDGRPGERHRAEVRRQERTNIPSRVCRDLWGCTQHHRRITGRRRLGFSATASC